MSVLAQLPKPHNLSMSFVFSIRDYFSRFDVWDWDYQMAERVLLCAMAGRNFGRQRYGFKAIWDGHRLCWGFYSGEKFRGWFLRGPIGAIDRI
jgi:hypothetical protein